MKNNATITLDDVFYYHLKDNDETIDLFGKDYLEEYGYSVSDELIARYKAAKKEWDAVQDLLRQENRKKVMAEAKNWKG